MVLQSSSFQTVPEYIPDEKEHRRQLARGVQSAIQGKINVVLPVTLNANSTTTIIKDSRISAFSAICPAMATTAHGAAAIASGIWVDGITAQTGAVPGQATLHHASSSNTDQNITFTIIG